MLDEFIQQALQVNLLSHSLRKKGYDFPIKVGAFNCDYKSEAKNMMKEFEKKYKIDMYEELRPMFDSYGYAKDVLQSAAH